MKLIHVIGTYFRSGPNEVSFHSAEAMQVIYKLGVKPDIWCTFSTSGDRTTVLSERDTAAHKFKRGRISKMFSDLNMGAVERQVMQHITEFVELLGEQKHSIQDLCDWLSFDVISGLLFSQRSDMLKSATHRPISVAYTSINLRCLVVCYTSISFCTYLLLTTKSASCSPRSSNGKLIVFFSFLDEDRSLQRASGYHEWFENAAKALMIRMISTGY